MRTEASDCGISTLAFYSAPLGLFGLWMAFPRAMPWAITFGAFGAEEKCQFHRAFPWAIAFSPFGAEEKRQFLLGHHTRRLRRGRRKELLDHHTWRLRRGRRKELLGHHTRRLRRGRRKELLGHHIQRLRREQRKKLLASPALKTVLQEFELHGATLRRRSRAMRASQVADRLCH